jgi:hypothetical protein
METEGKWARTKGAAVWVLFVIRETGFPAGGRTRIAAFARPHASIAPRENGPLARYRAKVCRLSTGRSAFELRGGKIGGGRRSRAPTGFAGPAVFETASARRILPPELVEEAGLAPA